MGLLLACTEVHFQAFLVVVERLAQWEWVFRFDSFGGGGIKTTEALLTAVV
jgi:hypothetical protein